MANFDLYAPKLKQLEGGFVNNPTDPGGATMMGVTLRTFRSWYGQEKTVSDLKKMTYEQWSRIMKAGYWDEMRADEIDNQSIAELCADWLVNSGSGRIYDIQRAIGVNADGIVGPLTLAALNGGNPQMVHYKLKAARAAFYADIVRNRASSVKFYDGWMNRLCSFTYKR